MTNRQFGKVLRPFVLLAMLLSFGCAQQMKSVQPEVAPEALANAEIKAIAVSDDASRIEISSDKSIVYTYYMLDAPPRLIVDLAQTTAGTLLLPIEVNKGNVKRIDVAKHEFGSGVLSRVDVLLTDKVDAVAALDQKDRKRLIITFPTPTPATPVVPAAAQTAPVAAPPESPVAAPPAAATVQVVDPLPVTGEKVVASPEGGAVSTSKTEKIAPQEIATAQKAELVNSAPPVGAGARIETTDTVTAIAPVKQAGSETPGEATPVRTAALKPGERGLTALVKRENAIQLEIAGGVDTFRVFRLNQPERLVIDIPKTKNKMPAKVVDINSFNLGKARVGDSPDKLRIVFDAVGAAIPAYTVTKNESGLLVVFGEAPKKIETQQEAVVEPAPIAKVAAVTPVETVVAKETVKPPAVAAVAAATPVAPAPAAPKSILPRVGPGRMEAIEFSQTDGISRITIKTSGTCSAGQPVKTAKGLSLAIKDCSLPVKLQRQLDTRGFASAIKNIAPYPVKGKKPETRIAVNLRAALPNSLKRDGDTLQWDFTEPVKAPKPVKVATAPKEAVVAAVPPVALDKDMAETKPEPAKNRVDKAMEDAFVLEKVSQPVTKQGKVYSGRKVTLEFSDADIRKIFQLLAEVSNQNFLMSDDVTGTISLKLVNVPWDQALDVILENKGLGMQKDGNIVQIRPKTKMKSLDDEAIEMRLTEEKKMPLSTVIFDINFAAVNEIKTQFDSLKSKRPDSSISTDTRTNKIIVIDIDPNIRKMRSLLESLDVPEKQVMIEARIVEAESTFVRNIGVQWGFGYQDGSASVANINSITGSMGGVVSSGLGTGAAGGGVSAGISFGKLLSNIQLDMRLSAAAAVGQVKIVSTPKVLTVNNKAAKISQGQMIPYQNTSSTEGAKTEFVEAALSLEVTPHITADGNVNMKIKASNNSVGTGSPPPINKKEATTELVVRNGETTVIGGIYTDREVDGDQGVPYLSDIPLLGYLFKSNSKSKTKNEMLIFITPKILN